MRLFRSDVFQRARAAIRTVFASTILRIAAVLVVLMMMASAIILWQYWISIVRDTQSRESSMAYLLAEQTTRTFQAVDLTLVGLGAVFGAAPLPAHATSFETLLAQRVDEIDFIRGLDVVDAAGRIVQSSGGQGALSRATAARYVECFARDRKLSFMIEQPVFSNPRMLTAIPVVRRLEGPDGQFAGVIVASVDPKYFRDFYRAVDLGRGGAIDLYQDNGSILLASTLSADTAPIPSTIVPAPMFDTTAELGLLRATAATGPKLVAYHRVPAYPLVVAVRIDIQEIRARWWHVAAPILGATGVATLMGVALAMLIARRVEERRQAQNRAMMVQKLEALGQMTASVSHDFNNLLAVMRSTLRLVRKHGPSEKILSAAEEAIDRGSGLVTQLLAFSRRQALEVQIADINLLLSGLAQVLGHAAGDAVTIEINKAPDLPLCRTDQTQFDAALMNLVVNAKQAMPKGGKVTISTALAPRQGRLSADYVKISVTDTGVGIAPGDIKRIFEPFFTTKAETGTGLGLSQVYGFMRQIGGDVAVSSVVGAGTTFTLLFPVVVAERGEDPSPGETKAPAASAREEPVAAQD